MIIYLHVRLGYVQCSCYYWVTGFCLVMLEAMRGSATSFYGVDYVTLFQNAVS